MAVARRASVNRRSLAGRRGSGMATLNRQRPPPGAPPGTLVVDPEAAKPRLHVFGYGPDGYEEIAEPTLEEVVELKARHPLLWLNVDGLGDEGVVRDIGAQFDIHPLILEDVIHAHQRPKVDTYGDRLFIVLRMASMGERLDSEQVSLLLGPGFLLSFQEKPDGDCLDPVRSRLRNGRGPMRHRGVDYLAYAVIDAIVDHYFPLVEALGDRLEAIEEAVEDAGPGVLAHLHAIRRDVRLLRHLVWPLRDALHPLLREEHPLLAAETRVHLRDTWDHVVQVLDLIENGRELASDLRDVVLSAVSMRLNEVMKVLTIISTVFIPLNFVVGVYGMNFNPEASPWNMPELNWRWGYPFALALLASVAGAMMYFFWRKGWLGSLAPEDHSRKATALGAWFDWRKAWGAMGAAMRELAVSGGGNPGGPSGQLPSSRRPTAVAHGGAARATAKPGNEAPGADGSRSSDGQAEEALSGAGDSDVGPSSDAAPGSSSKKSVDTTASPVSLSAPRVRLQDLGTRPAARTKKGNELRPFDEISHKH